MPSVKELAAAHDQKMKAEHPGDAAGMKDSSEAAAKGGSAKKPAKKKGGDEATAKCACVVM